jgi:translation initiation factor 2 beta subunit (eIF-2beta)/eIF-5
MILLSEEQIEDARSGIQDELSRYLGEFVLVRIVNDAENINFWIAPTLIRHKQIFDEICSRHIERVTKVGYG